MEKKVLGVRIDDLSQKEVLGKISEWLSKKSTTKLIFTPGPEFLVTAQKDLEFKNILNSADLNVPDGFGLHFAGVVNRVPGVDLILALCQVAEEKKWTVGLLGGREEDSGVRQVASLTAKKLQEKFPKLKIPFAISDEEADQILNDYLIDSSITLSFDILKCDIFFVGLGHPKQEKFLQKLRENAPEKTASFRVGIGVGGSFDLIAGVKKRAPKIFSSFGFEWLWRGLQDPRHFIRIWKATAGFLLKMFLKPTN